MKPKKPNRCPKDKINISGIEPYKFQKGEERARLSGSLGGTKAKENRARRESLKEAFRALLELQDEQGVSGTEKIALSAFRKAIEGDPQSIKLYAQIIGEFSEKIEVKPAPELPPLTQKDLEELKKIVPQVEE